MLARNFVFIVWPAVYEILLDSIIIYIKVYFVDIEIYNFVIVII